MTGDPGRTPGVSHLWWSCVFVDKDKNSYKFNTKKKLKKNISEPFLNSWPPAGRGRRLSGRRAQFSCCFPASQVKTNSRRLSTTIKKKHYNSDGGTGMPVKLRTASQYPRSSWILCSKMAISSIMQKPSRMPAFWRRKKPQWLKPWSPASLCSISGTWKKKTVSGSQTLCRKQELFPWRRRRR